MKLKELGGEFSFLDRIIERSDDPRVIVPNGDDASVVSFGGELVAVSTDTIVDGDHFSFDYFTPEQIGSKAVESSASDIVAIGGKPRYLYISLCLPRDIDVEPLMEIYRGISKACRRLDCSVLGGDTTHGAEVVISVTVVGVVASRDHLCPRSAAAPAVPAS